MTEPLRVGSLCSGYGGIELGLATLFPTKTVYVSEIDPHASRVLAARFPDAPNLGDLREVNWAAQEPVDILTAGFPCQPVSNAGKRKGTTDDRWIWEDIVDAVGAMGTRPRMLVLENVPGLLTTNGGHAMGGVVRGLASLGYVGRYGIVAASSTGAPHRRDRIFILAELADTPRPRLQALRLQGSASPSAPGGTLSPALLPTPGRRLGYAGAPKTDFAEHRSKNRHNGLNLDDAVILLPTPTARVVGHNKSLSPNAATRPSLDTLGRRSDPAIWGRYADAIARWEEILGRAAPNPSTSTPRAPKVLSAHFVEWMMGLDEGYVTGLDLPRTPALSVLGNGVVPQQAALAVRLLTT